VREHNWQAARIAAESRGLSGEEIYQRARQIVIAEIQAITYDEFLPAILGPVRLPPDHGYDPRVNPSIASAFSTAAYRIGHTMLSPVILRLGPDGKPIPQGNLSLRDAFFAATPTHAHGPRHRSPHAWTRGPADAGARREGRGRRPQLPVRPGRRWRPRLVALNIQRGRDMGLPDFNTTRADYGLRRVSRFADITRDPTGVAQLESLYASVDDVDLFVGLLMEDDLPGAALGETITTILADQFTRLRDGDRFFYTRHLSERDLARVRATHLSTIIERNTKVRGLHENVFFVRGHRAPVGPHHRRSPS
jgi:Animal haem peroxidase